MKNVLLFSKVEDVWLYHAKERNLALAEPIKVFEPYLEELIQAQIAVGRRYLFWDIWLGLYQEVSSEFHAKDEENLMILQ